MLEYLDDLNRHEELRAENDFLKMKMMLEHGAKFGNSEELPPELENDFLKHVIEFERQFELAGRIKVFAKIGSPSHFLPVKEIPDHEIEKAWFSLYEYMQQHGIELGVCSPNVSARELYRFSTEELFDIETDNVSAPGLVTWFIYDEFHPDHAYENTRIAVDECISYILSKDQYHDHRFANTIRFNNHKELSRPELKFLISKFRNEYDQIVPVQLQAKDCKINADKCVVAGTYEVVLMVRERSSVKNGNWSVGFVFNKEQGQWFITNIQIWGFNIV